MKVVYNNFALSDLGEVSLTQKREFEGGEAPQRAKVTLTLKVALFERCYADNYARLQAAQAALATPNALLVWQNDEAGETYVNQTATLAAADLPEEWGTYYQELNLTFFYYEKLDTAAQNLPLTLVVTTGDQAKTIALDQVTGWSEGGSTERFSSLRKNRKETRGRLEVKGLILGDPTQSLSARRAALALSVVALRAAMNAAEGRLTFGTGAQQMFDGAVRITEFKAEVNQAIAQIEYSFTAVYTLFPDETQYATAEATIAEMDNLTGEVTLTVSGKIEAPDEVMARAKLAALTAAILTQYGYATGQQLELTATANLISANADGDTFTELNFTGRWRRWRATNLAATVMRVGGSEPVTLGQVRTWADHYTAARFDEQREQRRVATNSIELAGTLAGDAALGLPERRAALLARQRLLKAEVNAKTTTLTYGDFSQAVKVDEFKADINQAETGIDWTLRAHYTLFPNPDSYATVEATFAEADGFTGELVLTASGKIQAVDEATARAKLATVLAAALKQYGYAAPGQPVQPLELDATANLISANADGDAFTELNFTGRWRRFKVTNQPAAYTPIGGKAQGLGNVRLWSSQYAATRFNVLRPHRERAAVAVEVAGTLTADASLAVGLRRAQLVARQTALLAAMNSARGRLVYGPTGNPAFSQTVKVEEFKADLNQAETGIDWTLKAAYTLFPEEASYATVEATAEEKNNFTGALILAVGGKIQAASEAAARAKLATVLAAFLAQYGYDQAAQPLELNATANLIAANADGDTFTELAFNGSWRKWSATNQAATFKATGKTAALNFGQVRGWEDGYKAERFDQMRSERRHATGTISASGTLAGQANLNLTARRAALLAQQRQLKAECNCADGTLTYGDWSQVVRVEEFIAHINQTETGIDWSFTASYSLFPNEGGYATAEFSADVRDDVESGDRYLAFAGEILAPNGALARAKLTSLRAATLGIYGFTPGQALRTDAVTHEVAANGDHTLGGGGIETTNDVAGVTFLRLNFNEEYRQRMPGTVLSSQFTISSRDDTASGLLLTSYAGTVTATGATADAATAAAMLRAIAIGANQEGAIDAGAFLKAHTLTIERRQPAASVPEEFVRLSFSYDYQSKLGAGRAYLEMTTSVAQEEFGLNTENVSGLVVAKDAGTALAIYRQQARALYAGRLIRSETLTQSVVQAATVAATANTDTLAFKTQTLRLEFSFSVHQDKLAGRVTAKYALSVSRDFRNLKRTSRLRGSVYAATRAAADTFLTGLTAPLGSLMESNRDDQRDVGANDGGTAIEVFTKLDFDDVYEDRLTGVTGLIEMRVTESVTYSATRWAMQPIPFSTNGSGGVSIPQAAGLTEGSRTVRGSVSAATRATAEAWAYRHRKMLTGDHSGNMCPLPEQLDTDFELVPRVDGIAVDGLAGASSKANVQIYRVSFQFGELLPNYLPSA